MYKICFFSRTFDRDIPFPSISFLVMAAQLVQRSLPRTQNLASFLSRSISTSASLYTALSRSSLSLSLSSQLPEHAIISSRPSLLMRCHPLSEIPIPTAQICRRRRAVISSSGLFPWYTRNDIYIKTSAKVIGSE